MHAKSLSRVWLFETLWTVACQVPVSMGNSWGMYQRHDFSEPRLLYLPIHRKAVNSLTWDVWFSLISNTLLMFQLPGFCCKDSYISWLVFHLFRTAPWSNLQKHPASHYKLSQEEPKSVSSNSFLFLRFCFHREDLKYKTINSFHG